LRRRKYPDKQWYDAATVSNAYALGVLALLKAESQEHPK